jgi:hypothetical protein
MRVKPWNRELSLPELDELFCAERMERIDGCRSARRKPASEQGDAKEQHSHRDKSDRIGRLHIEEDAFEVSCDPEGRARP